MVENRLDTAVRCLVYKNQLIYVEKNNNSPIISVKNRPDLCGKFSVKAMPDQALFCLSPSEHSHCWCRAQ